MRFLEHGAALDFARRKVASLRKYQVHGHSIRRKCTRNGREIFYVILGYLVFGSLRLALTDGEFDSAFLILSKNHKISFAGIYIGLCRVQVKRCCKMP